MNRLTDGIVVEHPVQAQHTANSGQREAQAKRDAGLEPRREHGNHREVVAEGHHEHGRDAEFLKDVQFHGSEELLLLVIISDECRSLDDWAIDGDADALGELEIEVKIKVAELIMT